MYGLNVKPDLLAEEQYRMIAEREALFLKAGELKKVWSPFYAGADGKLYCQCGRCGKMVRVNKPLFGGLHLCV